MQGNQISLSKSLEGHSNPNEKKYPEIIQTMKQKDKQNKEII